MKITYNNVTQDVSEFIINNRDVIDHREMISTLVPMMSNTDLILYIAKHGPLSQKDLAFMKDMAINGNDDEKDLFVATVLPLFILHISSGKEFPTTFILTQLVEYHLAIERGEVYDWSI